MQENHDGSLKKRTMDAYKSLLTTWTSIQTCLCSVYISRHEKRIKTTAGCVAVKFVWCIRRCRHRLRPPPLCFQWSRWWRSKARWRHSTWAAAHQAGRAPRLPRLLRLRRWRSPMSWRASVRRCSHHWVKSPWRRQSWLGSGRGGKMERSVTSLVFGKYITFLFFAL